MQTAESQTNRKFPNYYSSDFDESQIIRITRTHWRCSADDFDFVVYAGMFSPRKTKVQLGSKNTFPTVRTNLKLQKPKNKCLFKSCGSNLIKSSLKSELAQLPTRCSCCGIYARFLAPTQAFPKVTMLSVSYL